MPSAPFPPAPEFPTLSRPAPLSFSMNPSISIVCDATFGAGSENFGTVTGNVTFQDGSANSGTVTGNAVFEGTAEHKAGATVTGDATFGILSVNNGTVSGTVVPPSIELSPAEGQISFYQFLQYNSNTIQQYTAGGWYNGRYAVNGQPYMTLAEAEAALAAYLLESTYILWLSNNSGLNQFVDFNNPNVLSRLLCPCCSPSSSSRASV